MSTMHLTKTKALAIADAYIKRKVLQGLNPKGIHPFSDEGFKHVQDFSNSSENKLCVKLIDDLSGDEKKDLSAIVALARGDYKTFKAAYAYWEKLADYYRTGKPLEKYIPKGIAMIEKEGIVMPQ